MEYFSEFIKACGVGILCAVCIALLSRLPGSGGVSALLRVGGGAVVFGILLLIVRDGSGQISGLASVGGEAGGYIEKSLSVILKALGVALMSRFCSGICRDCNEASLADGVESVGKAVIFLMSVPIFAEIVGYIREIPLE